MASISEQRVDENGIYIRAGNGRDILISPREILDRYSSASGTTEEKRLIAREYVKNRIEQFLGRDMVAYEAIDIDFNMATGQPTSLIVRNDI